MATRRFWALALLALALQQAPASDQRIQLVGDLLAAGSGRQAQALLQEILRADPDGRQHHIWLVVEVGRWTLYHSGDTLRYPGMVEILRSWDTDLALLPISVSPKESAEAAEANGQSYPLLENGERLSLPGGV